MSRSSGTSTLRKPHRDFQQLKHLSKSCFNISPLLTHYHVSGVDDGRMDPPGALGGLYGGTARSHSSSSSSASPPHGAATLIVPHPLAASKGPEQHHVVTHNGSGRKYQCKMCPSVRLLNF